MTSRERVLGSLNRSGYDRIPVKHEGTPEVNQMLMEHFGLSNMEQLLRVRGRRLPLRRAGLLRPGAADVSRRQRRGLLRRALQVRRVRGGQVPGSLLPALRRHQPPGRPRPLALSHAPTGSTTRPIRQQAEALREQGFAVCCGTAGDMDFINSIARARGMEQVLMDLIDDNPVYLEIMQARFEFYYEMHSGACWRRPAG